MNSLSSNGYSIVKNIDNVDLIAKIKKDLTVSPKIHTSFGGTPPIFELFRENDRKIYMPRCYGLEKFGIPHRNTISEGTHCENLNFEGTLRKEQEEQVKAFIDAANNPIKRGGIISVKCAGGKTVMAIYCACHFKKKTLFIHHKDFLGNQFKERANMFAPKARIGIIKQDIIDVVDKDFVIASLQSLAKRDYPMDIFSDFGLVIIDECHHTSAEVFSRALIKIVPSMMLGLSATLDRKDGLRKVFEWFIGKQVLKDKSYKNKQDMIVKTYTFNSNDPDYNAITVLWNGQVNSVKIINNICNFFERTKKITNIITEILKNEIDRKILILSERKNQLKVIEKLLDNNYNIGYYVGGMTREKLKESENMQIILATYQMASEGMDIPALNTLILASPITSIEQSIGRIQRQLPHERKYIPMTIDIIDEIDIIKNKFFRRLAFYKKMGFSVEYKQEQKLEDAQIDFVDDDDI
jgi:superfamily II DNA or RNA helicase